MLLGYLYSEGGQQEKPEVTEMTVRLIDHLTGLENIFPRGLPRDVLSIALMSYFAEHLQNQCLSVMTLQSLLGLPLSSLPHC